jgi:hypothetical protein
MRELPFRIHGVRRVLLKRQADAHPFMVRGVVC